MVQVFGPSVVSHDWVPMLGIMFGPLIRFLGWVPRMNSMVGSQTLESSVGRFWSDDWFQSGSMLK